MLANPNFGISTKRAYNEFDKQNKKNKKEDKAKKLISAIKTKNIKKISENLHNDFEKIIIKEYPIIKKIKNDLIENNALNALMSGSGATVFGIFQNGNQAGKAYKRLKRKYDFACLTKSF